jgi:hypothetical protein
MLQVFRIDLPTLSGCRPSQVGWALARSVSEVHLLIDNDRAAVTPEPERLWVSTKRLIWTKLAN